MRQVLAILVLVALGIGGFLLYRERKHAAATQPSGSPGSDTATAAGADDPGASELARVMATSATNLPPAAKSARIGKLIDLAATAVAPAAREAWDPAAIVAAVGKDRAALFAWVRDHTALVPYRGSLRGAVGVLMDRVGNSLDRALLLAELLSQAGLETRLATATLDGDTAAKLASTWNQRARPPLAADPTTDDALLATLVTELGADGPALERSFAAEEAAHAKALEAMRKRVAAQAATLGALVPAPADAAAPATDPAIFAEHWWVQVKDGEAWSDLDPTLPDATPGKALAPAAADTVLVKDLTDDHRHTLTVRVIGEVWHGETRDEATLVEHTFAPSSFYGQRIVVSNLPVDLPEYDALAADPHPPAIARAALVNETEWIPVLRVGTAVVAKQSVTDGGEMFDVTDANGNSTRLGRAVQRATKTGVGGANDLLGQLPDDGSGEVAAPKPPIAEHSGFTAEWLEYELRAPGEEPRIARRVVFDMLGAADRTTVKPIALTEAMKVDRGLALIGETELLPLFAAIPEAFVADRAVKSLVEGRPVLVEIAGLGGKPMSADLRAKLGALAPLPGPLYSLALARAAWSPVASQVYLDRLDMLAESSRLVTVGTETKRRDVFDIVANSVGVYSSDKAGPRPVRIVQGVVETAAETAILACSATSKRCVRGANTSDELAVPGKPWTVASSPAAPELARFSPPLRTLAAADLASGYALVVPPADRPATTWWRIHPATGETLGMGPTGGTAMTEQIMLAVGGGVGAAVACHLSGATGAAMEACIGAAFFGAVAGYAGIEYEKRRRLAIVTGILAASLGIAAATL